MLLDYVSLAQEGPRPLIPPSSRREEDSSVTGARLLRSSSRIDLRKDSVLGMF